MALLALFVLAGYVAPFVLSRALWPYRAPRLGVAAWLTLAATCAVTAVFAIGTVALPAAVAGHGLADWWHACLGQWRHYYGDANVVGVAVAGAVTVLLVGKLVYSAVSYRRNVVGFRRTHQAGLSLLSFAGTRNVVVVPHPVPTAYCVPGRPGQVVMTDSAVRALSPEQVEAVVAHERAHLVGRHSLLVDIATVLQRALGLIAPVFRCAANETAALVEMIADEAAVAKCPAPSVADALFTLAQGAAPSTALAASGPDLVRRVHRLISPPQPLGTLPRLATLVVLSLGVLGPAAAVVGPVAAAVVASTCAYSNHH